MNAICNARNAFDDIRCVYVMETFYVGQQNVKCVFNSSEIRCVYAQKRKNNSKVFTVDINPNATKVCKEIVSENVSVHTGDSVGYLNQLSKDFLKHAKF